MKQKVFKNIEALIKIKDFKKSDFEKRVIVIKILMKNKMLYFSVFSDIFIKKKER